MISNDVKSETVASQQLCTIRIMFPVDSDETAIANKKLINEATTKIANVRMDFSLQTIPNLTK